MDRSRYDSFTRRDRHGADSREDSKTVDLFMKFRQFRPYLQCRLKKIHADNRDREFREEVDDIKYFLSVMSDMLADENHGAAALQGFIDRIHEMVRKNPLSEGFSQNDSDHDDEEPDTAPRSPSPTDVSDSFSGPPTTARTIPLERNAPDFNYFDSIEASIERGIHDRKKPAPPPRSSWDLENDPYNTRGPNQDIDMRGGPVFKPMLNTTPMGQGAPRSSQYQENNNGNYRSTSFGRGTTRDLPRESRDENFYDWNKRGDKSYPSSNSSNLGYRREDSFSDQSKDDPWRGDSFGRGRAVSGNDYNRAHAREREYPSHERDRQDYSRDFSRRDHDLQYDRGSSYSKESSYIGRDREPQHRTREDDSMYERRSQPQYERRRRPSNTSYDQDGSVHIDYHHGEDDQSWNNNSGSSSSTSGIDRDMRYPPPSSTTTTTNPGLYTQTSYDLNQQQMYLNNQQNINFGANNYMQTSSVLPPGVTPMMASMGLGLNRNPPLIPGGPPGLLTGFQPNIPPPRVQPGFVHPTATASTSVPYTFPEAGGPQKSKPTVEPYTPDPNSEERLKELFKQKAQQAFGRNKPPARKDNLHNPINNIVPPSPSQKVITPQKSPQTQGGLLASNQMLSDRDPRLHRQQNKRPSQGTSTSQNDSYAAAARTPDTESRVELDPRLARRERPADGGDRNAYNNKQRHLPDPRRPDRQRDDRDNSREKTSMDNSAIGENRDRVARVNLDEPETYSNSRRLDDTRDRVKGRLPVQTEQTKSGSKLQEIRKQVENERFHVLGRPISKKTSSFDEAIVVPVETPMRPHPKEASSSKSNQKSKEISKESDSFGSQKEVSKDKEKEKAVQKDKGQQQNSPSKKQRGRQRNASSGNDDSDAAPKPRHKRKEKSNSKRNQKESSGQNKQSQSRSDSNTPKKTTLFRIPKIKKPDPPPPPPRSPSPEPESQEIDMSAPHVQTDANSHASQENPDQHSEKLNLITDDIIRTFVLSEMDTSSANSILGNPEFMSIIKDRLKLQILEIFKNENSSLEQITGGTDTPREPEALPETEQPEVDTVETEIEPGGHRSRSVTRKRNTKRRSSLEKLHDALKEMRFDAMLPLGPRRCTLGQTEETPQDSGTSAETKDAPTSSTASASTKKSSSKTTDASKSANVKSISGATDGSGAVGDSKSIATGKKGTKRKRKASKVKPNKKKKGPVTRAQAAVKTAIKIQHKPGQKKRKNVASPDETRITRSMRSGGGIKIKLEPVEVKEEPEDPSYGDTAASEMEYLVDNNTLPETEQDGTSKDEETSSISLPIEQDLPTFDQDYMIVDDGMSIDIDIKNEPEEMQIDDVEEPDLDAIKIEVADTDYNADLSDFLPDIPTMGNEDSDDSALSILDPETSAMDLILNQIEGESSRVNTSSPEPEGCPKDCFDVIDSLLDEVEDQQSAITEEPQATGDSIPGETTTPSLERVEGDIEGSADSDDSEEPNDFFQIPSDYENSLPEGNKEVRAPSPSQPTRSIEEASTTEPQKEPNKKKDDLRMDLNLVKTEVFEENHNINIKQEAMETEGTFLATDERNVEHPDLHDNNQSGAVGHQGKTDASSSIPASNSEFLNRLRPTPTEDLYENVLKPVFLPTFDPATCDPDAEAGRLTNLRGRDLYKCPNTQCDFQASNAPLFKDHVSNCIFTPDGKSFGCPHCDKRVKAVINLLEHLKTHGEQKQRCSLCTYKTWATSELTRHMKSFHKVYNHKAEKIEASDSDDDPELVIYPKDVASRISTSQQLKDSYACYADRLVFGPNDVDKVPNRQIFQSLAYCSSCTYSTKVRVNFIRHLQVHNTAKERPEVLIPCSDPVNPVPCLERKELFFDKMTNWAGSSHEKKQGNVNSDSSGLPQFVSEQFRYVCSVKGCEQITVDEYMLRTHIRTLHSNVEFYKCPHCDQHEATRSDKRNTVPVDKLGVHLKLHGRKLYRCAYCDVIHTQVALMEKHLPEKHPERKPIHYLIRNLDSEGNVANRRNSNDDAPADTWRCTLCASKQLFSTYLEVKNHCAVTHKIVSQFLCFECKYNTDDDVLMCAHDLKCKPKNKNGKILIMWYRSEFNVKPEAVVHGPLWKRSTSSVKHIRGIFLEDVKEKAPRAEKQENSSRQSLFTSSEKIATPAILGKTNRRPYKPPKPMNSGVKQPPQEIVKLFTCPKCNLFKTKSAANMRVHLYNEMGYQRYRCKKCNIKFVTESSLKGHMIGDHGESLEENCFELLPIDSEIENYVNAFFSAEEEKNASAISQPSLVDITPSTSTDVAGASQSQPVFICKHCSQECQSAHNLKTHVLAKHIASDRYSCGHCSTTFWNKALVRNHHTRTHRDMPYFMEENFKLDLSPEFWSKKYGLPLPPVKRGLKRSLDEDKFISEPTLPTPSDDNLIASQHPRMPDLEMSEDDRPLFDFANCDTDPALIDDVRLGLSSNGTTDDVLLQQLFEDSSTIAAANRISTQNTFAYKCFHCLENTLSVRGARSHWEKIHSIRPEERCNYYEYKAFNESNQLPSCIQLTCSFCEFTTSSLNLILDHHDVSHPDSIFRMKRKLRVGYMAYECKECSHECCTLEHMLEHFGHSHSTAQKVSYLTTDLREKMENADVYMGKLVEDTVRYACNDPICYFDFNTRAESVNHMVSDHGIMSRRINIKYNRHIINQRIRVPMDEEGAEPQKTGYQCPMCEFQVEDRQKLVTEHLGEHVHTYICPTCTISFRSYLDTKFHIRLQHADPTGTPLINREMVKARELLENAIIQVKLPRRKSSQSQL